MLLARKGYKVKVRPGRASKEGRPGRRGDARVAEKAGAHGRKLGPGFCVPGLLGLGFWALGVKAAGSPDVAGSGPDVRRGRGAIRLSLKVGFNFLNSV